MSQKSSHHHAADESPDGPRSKPIHHSWIFWVGVALTFLAILTYVFTLDLSTRPRVRTVQPTPSNITGTH